MPEVVTRLGALEPLCGGALALCLAYLALDRFRYRSLIQQTAASKLTEDCYKTDGINQTTPFKTLAWLAGPIAPPECLDEKIAEAPSGLYPSLYAYLFKKPADEILIVLFSLITFFILIAGVCENANVWPGLVWLVSLLDFGYILSAMIVACVAPVLLVLAGRSCVKWANEQSEKMGKELTHTAQRMQGLAQDLPVPQIPTRQSRVKAAR